MELQITKLVTSFNEDITINIHMTFLLTLHICIYQSRTVYPKSHALSHKCVKIPGNPQIINIKHDLAEP